MNTKCVLLLVGCYFTFACAIGLPEGIEPVKQFDVNRYMGTWYEIARVENRFERGMTQVRADYALTNDGTVRVTNRGIPPNSTDFKIAQGKAKFVGATDIGHLKVSFFGPFYGSYVVFELGDNYDYSFVSGSNRKYLWFLSRTPTVSQASLDHFSKRAEKLGFDTSSIVFVDQSTKR